MPSTLNWIRRNYNVPAFKGVEITYQGKSAVILSGRGPYVRMRVEGERHPVISHPTYAITYPVLPLPKSPRGWCWHCGEDRALRLDGTTVRHLRNGASHFPVEQRLCPGARKPPTHICSWTIPAEAEEAVA